MEDRKRHEEGMKIRREILGNAHVDRAISQENEFTADFQDLITRYAWGELWARPGLDKKTRSLITIGMMIALNRADELRLHLHGALNNSVTHEEIREVLLHSAIYCGVPAANSAFHIAVEFLAEAKR
ncbi:MAG TPA: 4-carboxymuconolactone decarboxylase [Candidatus Acidoferrum sp.]|jgi:4-carboxymuconolactone decarboxylase